MTILVISNEEMDDIMKIIKPLVDDGSFIKGNSETIENDVKERKGRFLGMLLGTLGASLLGKLLTVKGVKTKIPHKVVKRSGEGRIRAGEGTTRAG